MASLTKAPVVIVANHLSYADANVIEVLLQRAGNGVANRLTALAGPKVFTSRAARYLEVPGTRVLPAGLTGPETVFPVDASAVHPARVVLQLGRPIRAATLVARADGDRRLIMDAIGLAVAEALPPEYRGVYRNVDSSPEAKSVLHDSRGAA